MRSKNDQAGAQTGIVARVGLELLIEAIYMIDVALCGLGVGCADCEGMGCMCRSDKSVELTAPPRKDDHR